MSKSGILEEYEKKELISIGTYGNIYKGINKKTGTYVAIKEINKIKYQSINDSLFNKKEFMKKMKTNILIYKTFETTENFYIVMEFCVCNLEEYIKMKKERLSLKEIQQILIQLNNILKKIIKENIIIKDLKLSNILLSIYSIDKINIKLSKHISNKFNKINSKTNINNDYLTISPQILKGKKFSNKTDLWSLGIIIYYLLFKEYPFNGNVEYQIIKYIESKKQLKEIKYKELKDLVYKMLLINENERISWNDYFNDSFFKKIIPKEIGFPDFDFICKKHLDNFNYYCKKCKYNICELCKKEHTSHDIISFSHIGFSNLELKEMENLINEFEENINTQIKFKKNILNLKNKIKSIKENNSLYEEDSKYNYKKFYINCLKLINEEIKIKKI